MNLEPLLTFIAHHEGRGNFDIVWGGIKKADYPPKPLTKMTIREVLAWQDKIDPKYRSEAAGAFQIMEDTLRGLYAQAGLSADALFDPANQKRMAIALLKRRGLDIYLEGRITPEQFGLNVAKEWASMPCPIGSKYGRSYYDGDGLNSTKVKVADYMAVIRAVKTAVKEPTPPPTTPKPVSKPATGGGKGIGTILPFFVAKPLEKRMGSTITTETARLVRHAMTPIAVIAVTSGILPEFLQAEFIEVGVIVASFIVSLAWSKFTGKKA